MLLDLSPSTWVPFFLVVHFEGQFCLDRDPSFEKVRTPMSYRDSIQIRNVLQEGQPPHILAGRLRTAASLKDRFLSYAGGSNGNTQRHQNCAWLLRRAVKT